jgi:hypothetical protein
MSQSTATAELDAIMEDASTALVRMEYLRSEALSLKALRLARAAGNWAYYARILLPLQEARRQRRIIAAEGWVRLGTSDLSGDPAKWLDTIQAGSIVVTHPHNAEAAHSLDRLARRRQRYVEVLFADNSSDSPTWTLRSFTGPAVQRDVPAPPREWIGRWLKQGDVAKTPDGKTPGDWFIDATEALGDAAMESVAPRGDALAKVEALETCLEVVTDHEFIHQHLGAAARELAARR